MDNWVGQLKLNKIHCLDCLEGMKKLSDKSIDLVLTDPPYGLFKSTIGGKKPFGTTIGGKNAVEPKVYPFIDWDIKLTETYFKEILRISKNQIIFGGEHLSNILPQSRGWYCWDKLRGINTNFSDCEFIWTSFDKVTRMIRFKWNGMLRDKSEIETEVRYHPTQKPMYVIGILIKDNSEEGQIICDPFMGSGTTAVMCKKLNRNFIGFEISSEYCEIAERRLRNIPKRLDLYSWNVKNKKNHNE